MDLVWNRSSVPPQYDQAGAELPKPVLHFGMTLEDRQAAREFLIDRGPSVVVYRLAPRYEGILMVGLADDGQAKRIARGELGREVPEGLFGQVG